MAIAFTPLQDRVLVKKIEGAETMRGGIIIPDSAKEKPTTGEVVAVGKGRVTIEGKLVPTELKVGDTVLFGQYHGDPVPFLGDEYVILEESRIYGIVNK